MAKFTDTRNSDHDKSIMQKKEGILQFTFGEYPAIGILHFEERRDERTKANTTDIFGDKGWTDEELLHECFQILYEDKYQYIKDKIAENKKKGLKTEWIAAFQTDEIADNGLDYLFVFVVFSIDIKQTAMNGIEQGQEALICVTLVKDKVKGRHLITDRKTVEASLCYCYDEDDDIEDRTYKWRTAIPR